MKLFDKNTNQSIDFSIPEKYKKIAVNCSGGADSSILLYTLIKYLEENNRTDTTITVLTCANDLKGRWNAKNAAKVINYIIEKKCEAIRYGIDWNIALSNICQLLTEPNVDVRISPTVNMYSIPDMKDFVEFFINLFNRYDRLHEYIFNFNMVQEPELSPMSMPVRFKRYLDLPIKICKDKNIFFYTHLENVRNLIGTKIDKDTANQIEKKFNYFKHKRPDMNWDALFPHINKIVRELNHNG
jgi:hypothetical protein